MQSPQIFDIFLSYSRADERFAVSLERALRSYRAPFFSGFKPTRLKVFRDASDASGNALSDGLRQALHGSRILIVLCSPAARMSSWVNDEIKFFADIHGVTEIVPVLIAGLPNDESIRNNLPHEAAFPDAFEAVGLTDPWAPDFREVNRHARRPTSDRSAWFHLLAILYRVTRERIELRERQRRYRQFVVASLVSSIILIVGWQFHEARQRSTSLELAEEVQKDIARGEIGKPILKKAISAINASPTTQAHDALRALLLRLHPEPIEEYPIQAVVTADGQYVAVSQNFGSLSLIDPKALDEKVLCGNFWQISEMTFTPEGKYLLGDGGGTLYEWDTSTGALVAEAPIQVELKPGKVEGVGIEWFYFDALHQAMVTGFRSFPPILWRLPSLERIRMPVRNGSFLVHPSLPIGISFPVVEDDLEVSTWSLSTGGTLSRLPMPPGDHRDFAWFRVLRNGLMLGAVGSWLQGNQTIRTIKLDDRGELSALTDYRLEDFDFSALFHGDSRTFWDYEMATTTVEALKKRAPKEFSLETGYISADISEHGIIGIANVSSSPIVFDPRSLKVIGRLSDWKHEAKRLLFVFDEKDKRLYAIHKEDSSITLDAWEITSLKRAWGPVEVFTKSQVDVITGVAAQLSVDGSHLFIVLPCHDRSVLDASTTNDQRLCGRVAVYDSATGKVVSMLDHGYDPVSSTRSDEVSLLYISPSGDRLVSSNDKHIFIWDVTRSTISKRFLSGAMNTERGKNVRARLDAEPSMDELLAIAEARLNECSSKTGKKLLSLW